MPPCKVRPEPTPRDFLARLKSIESRLEKIEEIQAAIYDVIKLVALQDIDLVRKLNGLPEIEV